jgi:hypothetical protein
MAAPGVIPMKCDDILRDEGLAADGEQIAVTGGPEPPDPDPLVSNWRPDAICAARRSNRRPPDPEIGGACRRPWSKRVAGLHRPGLK